MSSTEFEGSNIKIVPLEDDLKRNSSVEIKLKITESQQPTDLIQLGKPRYSEKAVAPGPTRSILRKSSIRVADDDLFEIAVETKRTRSKLPVITKSDSSVYPSYTNLTLPYRVVCRQRYQRNIQLHHDQFIKEIKLHEMLQPFALNGVRLHREFCDPILRKVGSKDMIKLSLEQERRLEFILKTDPKDL